MVVLCLGQFLFWSFWPFLVQKYFACGDILRFFIFCDRFLPIFGDCLAMIVFLNQVYGLRTDQIILSCDNFFGIFSVFFFNFAIFCSNSFLMLFFPALCLAYAERPQHCALVLF